MTALESIKTDCRHFKGLYPCAPHKLYKVKCDSCDYYDKTTGKILIIKLGAIGDVIRTTPLLLKLKEEYPTHEIWWLTYTPEVVPGNADRVMDFSLENILNLQSTNFDLLINLDKDYQACSLASSIQADTKKGFILRNGKTFPADANADAKFLTGLFDDLNKLNTKSYVEEMFEICGWNFKGEEYILECNKSLADDLIIENNGKKIVGLNTGCGDRWVSRLWSTEHWLQLIELLQSKGYHPLLLGGKQEHERNLELSTQSGAQYLGHFSLQKFIALVDRCDVIVSQVTMAMHIAIGLKKTLILMNNIFNKHEFDLYGRGEIIEPAKECTCFFSPACKNENYFCMDHLTPESIYAAILRNCDNV